MGHDVIFFEDSDDFPSCYNPMTYDLSNDPSYGLRFIDEVFTKYDIADRWCYYDQHLGKWHGLSEKQLKDFCDSADILLNLSGVNPITEYLNKIPIRAFVDTDPLFTQIRHLTDKNALQLGRRHNAFFSFGENFGLPHCSIPDDGFNWKPTRQPVITELWKCKPGDAASRWTTVMQWDSYKSLEYAGKNYGMKSSSFEPFFNLPQQIPDPIEIAMGSVTAPRSKLSCLGWLIENSLDVTKNTDTYQHYIANSKGEWSVAKQGYVRSGSGWFSERSCCYLASARPVVVQDTGFSSFIQTGQGLLCFYNLETAIAAIEEVNANYAKHCNAARGIAEEYFDYKKVLNKLLEEAFIAARGAPATYSKPGMNLN